MREIRVRECSEAEKQDKPGPLHIAFAFQLVGGEECDGKNPEGARQFYGGADREGFIAVFCGGADDGASVVDCERGPEAELRLAHVQGVADGRK